MHTVIIEMYFQFWFSDFGIFTTEEFEKKQCYLQYLQ